MSLSFTLKNSAAGGIFQVWTIKLPEKTTNRIRNGFRVCVELAPFSAMRYIEDG